jgi:hypothetical protein
LATKMLASTVQFSRYGRTAPGAHRVHPADVVRCPRRPDVFVPRVGKPAPSGLNSVPTAGFGRDHRGSLRTSRRTDDARTEPAELVSVPPLSSPRETVARDGMHWRHRQSLAPSAP